MGKMPVPQFGPLIPPITDSYRFLCTPTIYTAPSPCTGPTGETRHEHSVMNFVMWQEGCGLVDMSEMRQAAGGKGDVLGRKAARRR